MNVYCRLQPLSIEIWKNKYAGDNETTPADTMKRVADGLGNYWEGSLLADHSVVWLHKSVSRMKDDVASMKFIPAGRIITSCGMGYSNTTMINCFVSQQMRDDFDSIMSTVGYAATTMRYGGGIGFDFSTLRPSGSVINGTGAITDGPLAFMDIFDAVCKTINSKGHRKGAMMGVMRVDHPDIEKFIEAKRELGKLRNFNISVAITDKFMDAVANDTSFDLVFDGKRYASVRAKELWDKIVRSNYEYAEPGVLFIDRINEKNNLSYAETIYATNPCVTGNTPILTNRGWVPIKDVVGDEVDVWNGFEWSRVVPRKTGENREIVKVVLSDGSELECTKNHKFVLKDGTRVYASDLKEGDVILRGNWPVVEGGVEHDVDPYAQGFFSGDGWVNKETGGQYIGLHGDKKHIDRDWGEKSRNEYGAINGLGGESNGSRVFLYFGKNYFKSKDWVPIDATLSFRRKWLSGLIDSDGCVVASNSIQVSSKDKEFLYKVKLLVNSLGSSCVLSRMKDYWILSIPDSSAEDLCLESKMVSFENRKINKCLRHLKVVSIEDAGVADEVFCFTEEKRHLGCFNGILTGNCGEQPLPPNGSCLLGSINLTQLVVDPFTPMAKIDYKELAKVAQSAVMALFPVVYLSHYPLPIQREEEMKKRRIGIGVVGLGSALAMLGLRYGSEEAVKEFDNIMRVITDNAYMTSSKLARYTAHGSFDAYDKSKYEVKVEISDATRTHIEQYGIANSHLISIAPNGNMGLFAGVITGGIEPIFQREYTRRVKQPDGSWKEERVMDYAWKMYKDNGGQETYPDFDVDNAFVTAMDGVSVDDHLAMMKVTTKYVDSAVSKTINVPADYSFEDFMDVYTKAYDLGLKGCTTYRPNSVLGSVLVDDTKKDKEEPEESNGQPGRYDTTEGKKTCIPRPSCVEGKTWKIRWKGHNIYVTINRENDRLVEIFINGGPAGDMSWRIALCKTLSAVFRSEKDISFIVDDLRSIVDPSGGQWENGRYINSLQAAIGDIIADYYDEVRGSDGGETAVKVENRGDTCYSCGSHNVKRENGCFVCSDCGESKCG